jgi:hypothetical protein
MFYFVEVTLRYPRDMIVVRLFWDVGHFVSDRYFVHYCMIHQREVFLVDCRPKKLFVNAQRK